jgi:hypothetical protein
MTDEEIWKSLVQEARARAAAETSPDGKRTFLEIANRYDRLAQLAKGPDNASENHTGTPPVSKW